MLGVSAFSSKFLLVCLIAEERARKRKGEMGGRREGMREWGKRKK